MHAESILKRRFSDDATHGQICRSRESAAVRTATRTVAREAEQTHSLALDFSVRPLLCSHTKVRPRVTWLEVMYDVFLYFFRVANLFEFTGP